MPSIRSPFCPILRSPLAVLAVLIALLILSMFTYMALHDRHQIEIGNRQIALDAADRDLWQEYGLLAPDGSFVQDGAALPLGTRVSLVRRDGVVPISSTAQFSLTAGGDFGAAPAATVEQPPGSRVHSTATEWDCGVIPLGAIVRFNRSGRVCATILVRDIDAGPQKPLNFTIVDTDRGAPVSSTQ